MYWKAAGLLAAVLFCAPARAEKCPNMLIMLDRSGSMQGYKWQTAVEAINGFVEERQSVMRFGLFVFPAPDAGACGGGLWMTRCDFYAAEDVADALAKTAPGGMTPTADALAEAGRLQDMSDDSRRRFMILLTDGDPTCPDQNDIDANVDLAVTRLQELRLDGVKTFVIGFGQEASPARLDRMADAGGTPRTGAQCNNPAAPGQKIPCKYYEANDKASLSAAFDEIATIAQGELAGNSCDDSCYVAGGCPDGQKCVQELHYYLAGTRTLNLGKCVEDPCATASCGVDQGCRDGACIAACMSPCAQGTVCIEGTCGTDPCASGSCASCPSPCPRYLVCLDGLCVDDPCRNVRCPVKAPYCHMGSCYASADSQQIEDPLEPGAPKRGCACGGGGSSLVAAIVLGALLLRRRRREA